MGAIKRIAKSGKRGRPPKGVKPDKETLVRLYVDEGKTVREIAEQLGCSKDMVFRCLKEYEIKSRTNARRSSLRQYDLGFLETGIREKGLRGFARKLKVDNSTLLHHIRTRKGKN